MTMYSFVPPFREATFCGVPLCVFDKLGCAAGGRRWRNTNLVYLDMFTGTEETVAQKLELPQSVY
jgi:hypothetical protein